jgi:hypothetical protein
MSRLVFSLIAVALLTSTSPAMAQERLQGAVRLDGSPMRLQRSTPTTLSGAAAAVENFLERNQPYASSVDADSFRAQARPRAFRASIASSPQPTQSAPYVWCQSMAGGYSDSSGHISRNVWAADLYKFGGRFQDGTPVPREPITDFNSMGHAYHTGAVNGSSFWFH